MSHVEAAGIVPHRPQDEAQWEIDRAGPAAHAAGVEDPAIHERSVAVEKFAEGKLAGHRLLGQKGEQKIGRKPLYVVETVALYIECSSLPVGGINQAVKDVA